MAKPRVFISSTFFDLKTVRDDLDRFVRSHGFEPVRHEQGHVSYGSEDPPEVYAYSEIDSCDIVVCVIGGRYGSSASSDSGSITQNELRTAMQQGKQVYIFIDANVLNEFRFYRTNRDVQGNKFDAVDDVKVYDFIEEVHALKKGNPIFSFNVASDIARILEEQWAGLFQRLLQVQSVRSQTSLTEELQRSIATVDQLVSFLSEQNKSSHEAIDTILIVNHPLFSEMRNKLSSPYRLFFLTQNEMNEWLTGAKAFREGRLVSDVVDGDCHSWSRVTTSPTSGVTTVIQVDVRKELFNVDGRLKSMQLSEWKDEYLVVRKEVKSPKKQDDFDDVPF